jgi:lia operon protein LiaG
MNNRNLIAIQIIMWVVLGIVLVFVLVSAISGAFNGLRFLNGGELEVVHEQTVPAADIERIALDLSSMDISVTVTDADDIRIVQLASAKLSPDEYFTLANTNGELRASQDDLNSFFGFLNFGMRQKLELYLPKSYTNDLLINTRSGNVTLLSELNAKDMSFQLTSGNLSSSSAIGGARFEVRVTSGNVSLNTVTCSEYDINAFSGNITLASLKGSGKIQAMSGEITIDALDGAGHDVQASSGNIRLAGFSGSGNIHTSSGSVQVDCIALSGDLSLSASSGNIRVRLPQEASYELYASCASGNINGNINMSYSKNGSTATARIGSGPYVKIDLQTSSGNIDIDQSAAS